MSRKKQPARGAAPAGGPQRGRQGYSVGTSKRGRVGTPTRTRAGSGGGGRGRLIAVVAAVVVVAVAAVAAYLLLGDDEDAYAQGLAAAGCQDQTFPLMESTHLADDEPAPEYNSNPPTSGRHRLVPALWGVYDSPIGQDILVHNLEHGGLVVQYGDDVPPETRTTLVNEVLTDRDLMLIAPYPELGNKIAYTMWTRLVTCDRYDQRVIDGLRAKRNQSPAPEVPQDPSVNRQPGF